MKEGWLMRCSGTGGVSQQEPPVFWKDKCIIQHLGGNNLAVCQVHEQGRSLQVIGSGCSPLPGTHEAVSKIPHLVLFLKCKGDADKPASRACLRGWCI